MRLPLPPRWATYCRQTALRLGLIPFDYERDA